MTIERLIVALAILGLVLGLRLLLELFTDSGLPEADLHAHVLWPKED